MADKLLIVLANTELSNPVELAPPLLQATVAAAMEYEVEVLFTGQAGQLAKVGVAEKLVVDIAEQKSAYDYITAARQAGVIFKLCTPVFKCDDDLLVEIDETVGSAYMITEAMDDSVVTFTY